MKSSIKFGRIAGIEIGVHYTWVLAFALIAWSLAAGLFPVVVEGQTTATYWIMGVLASLLLFASVLLHELAHSFVAKARGMGVSSITLFIFGGVSNLEKEPEKASTEFYMAIIGPATSLVLGGLLWAIGPHVSPFSIFAGDIPLLTSTGAALLYYLSSINIILGLFNLLPAFPLDGGRVLRSIIWELNNNLVKSTNVAAMVGRYFGWAFIAYGLFLVLGGGLFGGLWIAFIGWFLASAADASRREITVREHLTGVLVREVMNPNPVAVSPGTSVEAVVHDAFLKCHCRAVPVSIGNQPVGIITLDDVKKVGKDKWAYTQAEQIMAREPLHSVSPDDDLNTVLRLLARHGVNQLLVLQGGELVGMVNRADIIRRLEFSQELGMQRNQT